MLLTLIHEMLLLALHSDGMLLSNGYCAHTTTKGKGTLSLSHSHFIMFRFAYFCSFTFSIRVFIVASYVYIAIFWCTLFTYGTEPNRNDHNIKTVMKMTTAMKWSHYTKFIGEYRYIIIKPWRRLINYAYEKRKNAAHIPTHIEPSLWLNVKH